MWIHSSYLQGQVNFFLKYFISAAPGVLWFATEEFLTEVVDGGTPYNGLYRKGVPQRATLFRLLRLLKYMKE